MNNDQNQEKKAATEITGPPVKYTMPLPQDLSKCEGCPYPSVGFICWSQDGTCIKTELDRIHARKKGR